MRTIQCNCGNKIEMEIPECFDTATSPDLLQDILEGRFLSVRCGECDSLIKPELPVRIIDKDRGIDVLFRPDNERIRYFRGELELPRADRIVFGYHELAEKILMYINDLRDTVIEVLKYFYVKRGGPGKDLTVYLDTVTEENLQFRIHGLKNDEIGLANVKKDFYVRIEGEIESVMEKEQLQDTLKPPYVSIKQIYLEEDKS